MQSFVIGGEEGPFAQGFQAERATKTKLVFCLKEAVCKLCCFDHALITIHNLGRNLLLVNKLQKVSKATVGISILPGVLAKGKKGKDRGHCPRKPP